MMEEAVWEGRGTRRRDTGRETARLVSRGGQGFVFAVGTVYLAAAAAVLCLILGRSLPATGRYMLCAAFLSLAVLPLYAFFAKPVLLAEKARKTCKIDEGVSYALTLYARELVWRTPYELLHVSYDKLTKVLEDDRLLVICLDSGVALSVEKRDLPAGEASRLSAVLRSHGCRYERMGRRGI